MSEEEAGKEIWLFLTQPLVACGGLTGWEEMKRWRMEEGGGRDEVLGGVGEAWTDSGVFRQVLGGGGREGGREGIDELECVNGVCNERGSNLLMRRRRRRRRTGRRRIGSGRE